VRVAVVTPTHDASDVDLDACCWSVTSQDHSCEHVVVDDGSAVPVTILGARIIRLPRAHADGGNVARAVGSIEAISDGCDAVAYLDADNWYEPDHVASLVALHRETGAVVCSSGRTLCDPLGKKLGVCTDVDGDAFVDTSCMVLFRPAFAMVAHWFLMPPMERMRGDRYVWGQIVQSGLRRAHSGRPTLNYRTTWANHYRRFGFEAPPWSRELSLEGGRWVARRVGGD
jgi:glycosyltransferase involved in cell wall biosynthesis